MISSHELLGFMTPALAAEILSCAFSDDKPLYRATLKAVADSRKVRPVFLERQPRTSRDQTMLAALTKPSMELAAANLIRGWLVKKQGPMLAAFLDALGVPNKEGVAEDLPSEMDEAKLRAAVDGLLAKFSREAVIIYLHAFNTMNGTAWPNLDALLKTDPRLQF